jgi:hypothetical protein
VDRAVAGEGAVTRAWGFFYIGLSLLAGVLIPEEPVLAAVAIVLAAVNFATAEIIKELRSRP